MTFRLYRRRASATFTFLATVRVPSLADAIDAARAYHAHFQPGDRLRVRIVR
jgi:hypothetical protein